MRLVVAFTLSLVGASKSFVVHGPTGSVAHSSACFATDGDCASDDASLTRRESCCVAVSILTSAFALPCSADDDTTFVVNEDIYTKPSLVTVPLEFTGSELLIYYRVDGSLFRAVVDSGSPFLLIPGSCGDNTRLKSGCYREQGVPSGLKDTYEQFDGFEGNVEWRMAPVTLVRATGSLMSKVSLVTFGVASESILGGPGGVFFGLIRDTDDWIRPSFLSQTSAESLQLDLRGPEKTLTLSQYPLILPNQDPIRMVNDLRTKFGDPVNHYTARAQSVTVNGYELTEDSRKKPIYVIFDTGVTGMVVSRELFDQRYAFARQNREKNLWGHVEITFQTLSGKTVQLSAEKPLTTPFDPQKNWKKFRGNLIVIGLSFLNENQITIDIDRQNLLIVKADQSG